MALRQESGPVTPTLLHDPYRVEGGSLTEDHFEDVVGAVSLLTVIITKLLVFILFRCCIHSSV